MFICGITILRCKGKIHRCYKKRKNYSLEASGRNKMQIQQTPGRLIEKIRYTKLSFFRRFMRSLFQLPTCWNINSRKPYLLSLFPLTITDNDIFEKVYRQDCSLWKRPVVIAGLLKLMQMCIDSSFWLYKLPYFLFLVTSLYCCCCFEKVGGRSYMYREGFPSPPPRDFWPPSP